MKEIKLGDAVQLKSGGPRMTVSEISQGPQGVPLALCIWTVKGKTHKETFPIHSLTHA
jgi:uncharacterized protein YodC (DUF2158 family)